MKESLSVNMKRFLPYLIAIAAVALAGSAAYYSIFGLSKFYAGAATAVIIMGIAIEVSKIIATSVLHQYHKVLSWPVKIYLTLAIVLSMIITSTGIYGFLTNAYQQTATKVELLDGEVGIIENKKTYFQDNIKRIQTQIDGKNNRITTLSDVRSQQETRLQTLYDSKSNAAAKRTERLIKDADIQIKLLTTEIDTLNANITAFNDSIANLDKSILTKNSNSDVAGEVGPLRFISNITGSDMNTVVNWFTILLILIFDPMAIALVIVFNRITMKHDTPSESKPVDNDDTPIETATDNSNDVIFIEPIVEQETIQQPEIENPPSDIYDEKNKQETRKRSGKPVYW